MKKQKLFFFAFLSLLLLQMQTAFAQCPVVTDPVTATINGGADPCDGVQIDLSVAVQMANDPFATISFDVYEDGAMISTVTGFFNGNANTGIGTVTACFNAAITTPNCEPVEFTFDAYISTVSAAAAANPNGCILPTDEDRTTQSAAILVYPDITATPTPGDCNTMPSISVGTCNNFDANWETTFCDVTGTYMTLTGTGLTATTLPLGTEGEIIWTVSHSDGAAANCITTTTTTWDYALDISLDDFCFCQALPPNDPFTLDPTYNTTTTAYVWSASPNDPNSNNGATTQAITISDVVMPSTIYTVTVTDGNCRGVATATGAILNCGDRKCNLELISETRTCATGNTGVYNIELEISGTATNYSVIDGAASIDIDVNGPGDMPDGSTTTTVVVGPYSVGQSYSIRVLDDVDDDDATADIGSCEFTVSGGPFPAPSASIGAIPDQCISDGTSINITANSPAAGQTGRWSITAQPANSQAGITAATSNNTTLFDIVPGSYTLSWTVTDGVCRRSAFRSFEILPNPIFDLGTDVCTCQGDGNVMLGVANTTDFSYQWGGGSTATTSMITVNDQIMANTVYTLTVTDNNGCMGVDEVRVEIKECAPPPVCAVNILSVAAEACDQVTGEYQVRICFDYDFSPAGDDLTITTSDGGNMVYPTVDDASGSDCVTITALTGAIAPGPGANVDVNVSFNTTCGDAITAAYEVPVCAECSMGVVAVEEGDCYDDGTGNPVFDLTVLINFDNPPPSGGTFEVDVDGDGFDDGTPAIASLITLTALPIDGGINQVTIRFSDESTCVSTAFDYTEPDDCTSCAPSDAGILVTPGN